MFNLFQHIPTSLSTGTMEARNPRQSKSIAKGSFLQHEETILEKDAGKIYAAHELSTQVPRESLHEFQG